jgi:hypothetical protein
MDPRVKRPFPFPPSTSPCILFPLARHPSPLSNSLAAPSSPPSSHVTSLSIEVLWPGCLWSCLFNYPVKNASYPPILQRPPTCLSISLRVLPVSFNPNPPLSSPTVCTPYCIPWPNDEVALPTPQSCPKCLTPLMSPFIILYNFDWFVSHGSQRGVDERLEL